MSADDSDDRKKRSVRERNRPLRVVVTAEERLQIKALANGVGLTVSSYLRAVGLNRPLAYKVDLQAMDDLLQLNADLGRMGGLLKLWLTSRPGVGTPSINVRQLLDGIRTTQQQMLVTLSSVRRR